MTPLSSLLPFVVLGLATFGLAAPSDTAANLPQSGKEGMSQEFVCRMADHLGYDIEDCSNHGKRDEHSASYSKSSQGFHKYICAESEKHDVMLGGCESIQTPDEWVPSSQESMDFKKRSPGRDISKSMVCRAAKEYDIDVKGCDE